MTSNNCPFWEFIKGNEKRLFCIPVYQRKYAWGAKQCDKLFRDILNLNEKDPKNYFLGTIVYTEDSASISNGLERYTVIDGQQRLTTVLLLLQAIARSTENHNIRDAIDRILWNCDDDTGEKLPKINLQELDIEAFEKVMDDQIQDQDADDSPIITNYRFFIEKFKQTSFDPDILYRKFKKLEIVYISLISEQDNPQRIFESLNSTGIALTSADLIRNYLFMGQKYNVQEILYKNYWKKLEKLLPNIIISEFIRDYLTFQTGKISNENTVYDAFKKYCHDNQKMENVEELLSQLLEYGRYYKWIRDSQSPSKKINERLTHLNTMNSTTVYPFLLYLFGNYKISDDELLLYDVLGVILSYTVRRFLCGLPSNARDKVFATMKNAVANESGTLQDRVSLVLGKRNGNGRFPNNAELQEKLRTLQFKQSDYVKFILLCLEKGRGKEQVDPEQLTLEHIMPQKLSSQWKLDLGDQSEAIHGRYLNNLGNLTLTGYNSEISNAPFSKKLVYYKKSHIYITEELSCYASWGEGSIKERLSKLIQEIVSIWQYPDVILRTHSAVDRTEFNIGDEVEVKGRTPRQIEIQSKTIPVKTWVDFLTVIGKEMYVYDPEAFETLLNQNTFLRDTEVNMRNPIKIAERIYLERHGSATDLLKRSRWIIEELGMEGECSFKLQPKK